MRLRDHQCITVPDAGLAGQKNGRLLSLAEAAGFDLDRQGPAVPAEFDWPQYRDSACPRKVEPPRRPVAALRSVPIDHELDPAWRTDTDRQSSIPRKILVN